MEPAKLEICDCQFRKKIVVNITQVLDEESCGVPDSALADILDFELAGPGGQPVLRIKYCPWCGKRAPKPERVTFFETQEEEGEEWRGTNED